MKNLLLLLLTIVCSAIGYAQVNPNNHYVDSYYRTDGTFVQGHYRTDPNSTINDNYSTYPNVNPYTGVQGTITPDYYDTPYTTQSNTSSDYSGWDQEIYSTPSYDSGSSFPSLDYDYDPYW